MHSVNQEGQNLNCIPLLSPLCHFLAAVTSNFHLLAPRRTGAQLEFCAVAEGVGHDDILVEVVRVTRTVSLEFVDNLVNRDDWCLFSIHTGKLY